MKKTLALLAVLCLLLTSLPVGLAVSAENVTGLNLPDDDFIIEDEGNFDDDGYVAISSLEDLEAIRDDLAGNYYLTADIVIPEGTEFEPIGSADEPFIGTFDGSGHTITGLSLYVEDGTENVGLFGYNCGIIYGLGLVDCTIYVDGYAAIGTIAGYNAGGTITDCYATGTVEVVNGYDAYIGGIVGYNDFEGTVKDCYNVATITADAGYVGGIAGATVAATIETCYNAGVVNAADAFVGGVVAYTEEAAIDNCYYVGDLEDDYAVALTKAEAKNADSFVGFDFVGVWTMDGLSTYQYPELRAVNLEGDFEVEEDAYIVGIEVTTLPKTTYEFGEELDLTGGIVTVTYSDDTTVEIALADTEVTGFDSTAGTKELTVAYEGFTTTFVVIVEEEELVIMNIEVTTLPKTNYTVGDALDLTGGIVTVTYSNGTTAEIPLENAVVTGFDSQTAGTQELTVAYEGFTAFYEVTVKEKVVATVTVAIAKTGLKLTWTAVSGANSYVITRAEVVDGVVGEYTTVTTVSSATYTDTSVVAGTKYQYKVVAKNGSTELEVAVSPAVAYVVAPTAAIANVIDGIQLIWADGGADAYEIYRTTDNKVYDLIATTSELSYVDTTAVEGIGYGYKVRPITNGIAGADSAQKNIRRLTSPSVAVVNTPGGVKITWEDNEFAAKYYLYRSALSASGVWGDWSRLVSFDKATTGYVPAYNDLTAKNGGTYRYKLVSIYTTSTGADGEEATIMRLTVSSLGASNQTGGIQLEWAANTAAKQYYLYRSEEVDGEWAAWGQPFRTFDNTVTSFLDDTAVNGVKYRYMVRTVNGEYMSGAKMGAYLFRLETANITLANTATGIQISWTKNAAASKYFIYRSKFENGTWSGWTRFITVGASTTSYTDTTVHDPVGGQYRYMVRTNKGDNQSAPRTSEPIIRLRTPTVRAAVASNGIRLTWTGTTDPVTYTYKVFRSDAASNYGEWTEITTENLAASVGEFVDTTAVKGTSYKYSLIVVDGNSTSFIKASSAVTR